MKQYLIIYHKEDNDGVVSGVMFYDYLVNQLNIDKGQIELLPSDYNSLAEFANDHTIEQLQELYEYIIMIDISFSSEYMQELSDIYNNDEGKHFIWCDHHKPIIEAINRLGLENNIPGIRDINKSAILCVYEYLYDPFNMQYNQKNIPEIFRVLSAWDSWSYEREGYEFDYVKNINKGFTVLYNLDFNKVLNTVHEIITHWIPSEIPVISLDHLHNYGKQLNMYDAQVMDNIIKTSGDTSWKVLIKDEHGKPLYRNACAIFHQGATNSTMFKSLENTYLDHGLVFKHCQNGNWVLSMYNIREDCEFHCGDFLREKYNGGGHKGAAGCTLSQEQFIQILKDKII